MLSKRTRVLFVFVLVFAFALFAGTVWAQGPGGGGGGGPPAVTMLDVRGCAYFDDVLGVWRLRAPAGYPNCHPAAETDYKIDFGPEPYCPDPCLTGELITDYLDGMGMTPVTIKIGKNVIGTFRWSDDEETTILAQTELDGPARAAGYDFIPLMPADGTNYGRPLEGKWVRVYGRAGETEYAILAWELRYNWLPNDYGNWYWWRDIGQPWAKMEFLDCPDVVEG